MKPVDNRQSARIVGLEYGFAPLSAHSGDGHPLKPQALVPRLSEAGQLHGSCYPNLVRLALLSSASSCIIGLASLWLRKKQYDLEVSQVALAYTQAAAECPDGESWDNEASLVNAFADHLREIPRKRLICSASNFRSNLLAFASRKIGQFLFGWLTVAINRLGNFRDQIKRLLFGFHMAAVGIVKASNKPFTRKAVFRIFGRHKDSSSVVGLDDSTMDEAGGSGNAATSRVEELHGQCKAEGFVDLGVPFAQRAAEAEMLAPNGPPKEENSRQSRLFFAALTVLLDWTPEGKSILRVSGAFARNYLNGFWVHMAGHPGVYAHFAFLGSIRGEMLFSVDEWRPETDQQLCPPSPLLKLRGPFQKGPSDDL